MMTNAPLKSRKCKLTKAQ